MGSKPIVVPDQAVTISRDAIEGGWPMLDAMPYPVLEIQPDYTVTRANPAAIRTYGASAGRCYELSHGHDSCLALPN